MSGWMFMGGLSRGYRSPTVGGLSRGTSWRVRFPAQRAIRLRRRSGLAGGLGAGQGPSDGVDGAAGHFGVHRALVAPLVDLRQLASVEPAEHAVLLEVGDDVLEVFPTPDA